MKSQNITSPPRINPAIGDVIIGTTTFDQTAVHHLMTDQFSCAVAKVAPHSPPMSAWLELEGKPNHHVGMFQMNAASTAASTVHIVKTSASTKPLPPVEATAPPRSAPVKLKNAAIAMACRGVRTLVETTVAMALAASWKPLLYSKMTAARTTVRKSNMSILSRGRGTDI